MRLVVLSAAIEIAAGLGLLVLPGVAGDLLLGAPLDSAGTAVARVAGVALLSLGLTCWLSPDEPRQLGPSLGLLVYNLLVAICLTVFRLANGLSGPLLWPTVTLHAVIGLLLLRDVATIRSIHPM